MTERTCTIDGCDRPHVARGMCNLHWKRANAARYAERRRELYAANAEQERERVKAWRAANPEKAHASVKAWAQANPWAVRSHNAAKDARRRAPHAVVEFVDLEAVLATYGWTCHLCAEPIGSDDDLHFDHVQPLVAGGDHVFANLRPAHRACNIRKGATVDAPSDAVHAVAAEAARADRPEAR